VSIKYLSSKLHWIANNVNLSLRFILESFLIWQRRLFGHNLSELPLMNCWKWSTENLTLSIVNHIVTSCTFVLGVVAVPSIWMIGSCHLILWVYIFKNHCMLLLMLSTTSRESVPDRTNNHLYLMVMDLISLPIRDVCFYTTTIITWHTSS
jgi:hypothetical protein